MIAPLEAEMSALCEIDPTATALAAVDGRALNRAELSALLAAGRGALRNAGLGSHDRVAVIMPQGYDGAVALLQAMVACNAGPLQPAQPEVLATRLRALRPAAVITPPGWSADVEAATDALGIRRIDPEQIRDSRYTPTAFEHTGSGVPHLLLASSGSTGTPKWVRLDHSALLAGCRATARALALSHRDRLLLPLGLTHAHGIITGLLTPLLSGGTVVVTPDSDPASMLAGIRDHGITWLTLPPAMHRALAEQHTRTPLAAHGLRFLRSGAVNMPPHLAHSLTQAFGVPLIEAYGMTECPQITCNRVAAPRNGSVGLPVVEQLDIVDGAGRSLPVGEWGEIAIRGAPLMAGYLEPAEGVPAFRHGWFPTGDEGRLDADGYVYVRGRIGERINRGGVMITPAEIDAALMTHPQIREAVTFGVAHPSLGEDLVAAVVMTRDAVIGERDLRGYLSERLESRQVPSRVVAVEAIPVGAGGKVVRRSLAESLADRIHAPYEAPRDALEDTVVGLFVDALAMRLAPGRQVGRLTNFFLEGGDSLAATRVIAGLAHAGRGEHPPMLLFDNPTPAAVAEALTGRTRRAEGNLVTLQSEGTRTPLFIVHGLGGHLFNHVDLPQAFAPHRPVYGVQAVGDCTETLADTSITELAARYAAQILARQPRGPIHLVGFSLGGWYAHAVAGALVDRGARVGMLAVLDSHPPSATRVPLRGQLPLLLPRLSEHLGRWSNPPNGLGRAAYLRGAVRARAQRMRLHALHRRDPARAFEQSVRAPTLDPFSLLVRGYRVPRVPVTADVFAPPSALPMLRRLWRLYATDGVRGHPLFEDHADFSKSENAAALAAALDSAIAGVEGAGVESTGVEGTGVEGTGGPARFVE